MSASATTDHLSSRLPADAYYHLVRTLCLTLPPPLTDSPEDLARRNHAAIARIAALAPANAVEADVAAMFVAASEQWKDCLRLVQLPATTPEWAVKCRAQAIGMMRQANSATRSLLRLQDARRKLEADSAACNSAAWTEHAAINLMVEALAAQPAIPEPASEPEEKPAPVAEVPLTGVAATIRRQETDPVLIAGPIATPSPIPSAPRRSAAPARCPPVVSFTSTRPRRRSPPR